MRKTALTVAVGGLFIAPAHAQIVFGNETLGTLQLYGKLYPQFGYGTSKDPTPVGTPVSTLISPTTGLCGGSGATGGCGTTTPGPRRVIDVQNSYIGFRGERTISAPLKFIWQIETALNFDDPNRSTTSGRWSTRNSFLGARTNFGTVKLGNMDTIYKEYGDTLRMFGISSGNFVSASNVLSQIGLGRSTSARFHERKANSIQYETPQYAGFTGGFQYSPDEARDTTQTVPATGCTSGPGAGNCGRDAALYSYGVKWDSRSLYASVHQEIHKDFFGGSNNVSSSLSNIGTLGAHSRDTGTRFSGEWRYSENARVTIDIARLKYHEYGQAAGVRFDTYQHNTWALGWEAGFGGPLRVAAQYVRGTDGHCMLSEGAFCSTTGLTGYMLNAGVRWRFDRQTFVYAIAGKLSNGASTRYTNWAAADPARGANILQAALGISYTF
jgi:predicted porin